MIDEEKFSKIQKAFGRKLQAEGLKAIKDLNFDDSNIEVAFRAIEIGIELEKMAKSRDQPSKFSSTIETRPTEGGGGVKKLKIY